MSKDIKLQNAHIMFGNAMERLKELPDNSVESIVTDPPYGLSDNKFVAYTIEKWIHGERDFIPDGKGFMGKAWDSFVPPPAIWDECMRVLKPGGHLLAFFGSRTQDIGALSIRLAGFEIRDSVAWLYGSGFPKSLNIGKAMQKQAAKEGEAMPYNPYESLGTALKPAHEPIVVARKPLSESTVANNVLKWGTGGLNIDASRIGTEVISTHNAPKGTFAGGEQDRGSDTDSYKEHTGRFPANIILDETTAALLDEQSGVSKSSNQKWEGDNNAPLYGKYNKGIRQSTFSDTGGASRFFYVAKASKKDRNEGLEELDAKTPKFGNQVVEVEEGSVNDKFRTQPKTNFHPTVKPTTLMEYLIKLVTPIGGTVLDPFTGSGSTGKAALLNGFKFIGCELTEEYLPIIEGRLKFAENKYSEQQALKEETLFELEETND